MTIKTGTNTFTLGVLRSLNNTTGELSQVFERLSSGQRINRASDDAAGLAIAESLRADSRVYQQGMRNINDGLSLLNIADGALSELTNIVTRMQELAQQAANGSLSSPQRGALDEEAQALKAEFFRISRSTEFNGLQLFDGTLGSGISIQSGYGSSGSVQSGLGGDLGDGTFDSFSTIFSGVFQNDFELGDVNGDGNIDMVAVNGTTTLDLYLGNGSGGFGPAINIDSSLGYTGVKLGDIDGDGILDIVAGGTGGIFSLLGNGNGTFQSLTTAAVLASFDIELADLNNDGMLDLITGMKSGYGRVAIGNGDGTFTEVLSLANGTYVETGDFNGDGNIDFVSTKTYSSSTKVHFGDGAGGFSTSALGAGLYSSIADVGDFNGDGYDDIAVSDYYSSEVAIYLGSADGSFTESQTLFASAAGMVESGDFDGDGILDLVVRQNTSLVNYIGNGDGTFTQGASFDVGETVDSSLVADLNNDGVLDLVGLDVNVFIMALGGSRDGISPILDFSLTTQADALQALAPLQNKLNSLSSQRGVIGAFQSRLEISLNNNQSLVTNSLEAESRIRDADIASEAAKLVRLQILQQAGAAVLAQANQQPALVLQLLQRE